jgi:serine/threonine protein kinase
MRTDFTGRQLGQYQVIEQIGRGGMAVVYKAYHPALERYVAVKVLPEELSRDSSFVERFQREARAAANLNHPNIVIVYDVGETNGAHFIVMEYVEGPSLTQVLKRQGALPPRRAASVVAQIGSALDYAHSRGFVHRDIKPGNILITGDGTAKLTDFGIVKPSEGTRLTRTGSLLGTPAYMSPEQAKDDGIGSATDIYSLGIVTYELLSGGVPFSGQTVAVLHAHLHDPPDLSVLPSALQPVVGRALAKDPKARYPTAGAFAQALQQAVAARPPQREPMTPPPTRPPRDRGRQGIPLWVWGLGAAGFGAILLVGIVVGVLAGALARPGPPTATSSPPTVGPTATTEPYTSTPEPDVTPSDTPERSDPSPTPAEPATSEPPASPTVDLALRWDSIGWSVEGRELSLAAIGDPAERAVVVVGSIQGDQAGTRDLVYDLVDHFEIHPEDVPPGTALYFIPSLNPDGNTANSRYNAHGVDLNRNWDTVDWRSNAAVPGHPEGKPGAGGDTPFSEPETSAAANFLYALSTHTDQVLVALFHSSVRRTTGEVYPGGQDSVEIAYRYADRAGYDVEGAWAEYTTSGEMVTWCAEQGFAAIDVVVPGSQGPASQVPGTGMTLGALTVEALLDMVGAR